MRLEVFIKMLNALVQNFMLLLTCTPFPYA